MNPLTHFKRTPMLPLLITLALPCLTRAQPTNNKLFLQFVTGGDDLRGGKDNVHAYLVLQSGKALRFLNVNGGKRWPDHSSRRVSLPLPDTVHFEDIKGVRLATTFSGGEGGDNWNLDRLIVSATIGGLTRQLFDQRGAPLFRFTGDQRLRTFLIGTNVELILQFETGGDDLRGENDNVHVFVLLHAGEPLRFDNVNGGKRWPDHSSQTVRLPLPDTVRFEDIKGVQLETTFRGGEGGDNWNLDRLAVSARIGGVTQQLFDQRSAPLFRFTGDQRVRAFPQFSGAPYDLTWKGSDLNGLPLNPRWASQNDPSIPSLPGLGACRTPWKEPCTTQSPTIVALPNLGDPFHPVSRFCTLSGPLGQHVNWGVVTYEGSSAETKHHSDGDYSINLARDDRSACTLENPTRIHTEFDSNETINHFVSPWWTSLRQAVDAKGSALLRSDGAEVEVIEVGVIGLDCAHACGSEIHPVLALAIHTQDTPSDDRWAIFARNWGNEGFCSHDVILAPELTTVFLKLPWRSGATAVTVNEATTEWHKTHEHVQVQTFPLVTGESPTPLVPPTGFVVQIDLGTPIETPIGGPMVHGELHLQWTMGPDGAMERRAPTAGRGPPVADAHHPEPEDRFDEYLAGVPTSTRTQYEQVKNAHKPAARRWIPLKPANLPRPPSNFQGGAARGNIAPGRMEVVPSTRKQEFYKKMGEILRVPEGSSPPPR